MKKKGLTKLACLALSVALLVSGNGLLISASESTPGTKNLTTEASIAEVPDKIPDPAESNTLNPTDPVGANTPNSSDPAGANTLNPTDPAGANTPNPADPAGANTPNPADPAGANTPNPADPAESNTSNPADPAESNTSNPSEPTTEETSTTAEPTTEETPTTSETTAEETTSAPATVTLEHTATDKTEDEEINSIIVIDPLYEAELTSEELEELRASLQASTFAFWRAAAKPCATIDEAAAFVRGQMVDRDTAVTIQVPTSLASSYSDEALADGIMKKAMEYSEGCSGQEGDALRWGRYGYGAIVTGRDTENTQVAYTLAYHSTADQEWELTEKVETVLAALNLNGKSDYEKVRAIHDWICRNVKDEEDRGNAARYSAYSAACLGKAVCQGYAVLFYRMCKDAGLSQVRVVTGTMNGGAHGWNLIYLPDGTSTASAKSRATTGGAWYNVDCAWDGQGSEPKYTYFLKADDAFPGHVRDTESSDELPNAGKSYLLDRGKGWNLTPQYPSGPIVESGPDGKPQSKPGAQSNGGRLYRLGGGEYFASQDDTQKNKVYVFIQPGCQRSPSLANSLNSNIGRFSDTDIYLISTEYDDTKIRSFKNGMTSPSPALNFMYLGQALQDDWLNFTLQPAKKPIDGDTPIVVYVDKNNKIQYAGWGASNAGIVRGNLDSYCSSSDEGESLNLKNITYYNLFDGINHPGNPPVYQAGVTVMMLQAPTRDGYTFAGWYSDAGCTNKVEQITQSMSEDLNFYATWEKQPTITYELDGGTNDLHNPSSYNKGPNEIQLSAPIRNGYIFVGWYKDAAKTNKLADNKLVTTADTGDVTLYAKWTVGQTIQYVLNGGENHSGNRVSYQEGEEFSLYAPTRPDYTFTGWYTDRELTNRITGITKETTGSLTLYAGWKHNPTDPDNFPKVDMTLTEGNILMGIEGTYMTDTAEKILAELNRIRKEACDEGVIDGSGRRLTSADYKPLKWSASLEAIARLRAAEIAVRLDSDHKRPNGKAWNTVSTTANVRSTGENLAAYGSGTDIMHAINGWYKEKGQSGSAAGHYFNLINPAYQYVAVSTFQLSGTGNNPVSTAQEFGMHETTSTAKSEKAGLTLQDVEIAASAVTKLVFQEQSPLSLKAAGTADATVNATVEFKKGVDQILINRTCTGPVRQGIAWKSSDESVAAVDANGRITAKRAGAVTITATVGGKSAELEVIVTADTSGTSWTGGSGSGGGSTDDSGAGSSSTVQPGTGKASTEKPGPGNPPAAQPETASAPVAQPEAANAPAAQPGTGNPPTAQTRTNPPTAQLGTGDAPAEQPGTDETEKWNNILAEVVAAETGDSIRIDTTESPVVPGDVLTYLKGKDVTVILDMGSGITWSIDGKSITADDIGDINFDVKTGTDAIPADVVSGIAGDSDSLQLSLAHDGDFGFTATLSIDLGRERAGLTAGLHYYNENAGQLEFVEDSTIADDGTAKFTFTHASDYLIVMRDSGSVSSGDGSIAGNIARDNTNSDTGSDTNSGTGGDAGSIASSLYTEEPQKPWGLLAACSILFMAGAGAFIAIKKRKMGDRSER